MAMLRKCLNGTLILLLLQPVVWAAPDTTMSIAPSATAGSTITASDENTRSNSVSTTYNAHSHTDISQVANTLNVGDNTAGNKTVCGNAADTTDLCIRFNDTDDRWTINQTGTTYASIATSSGTTGILNINDIQFTRASNFTIGDGTDQSNQAIAFNDAAATTPMIRINNSADELEYSHNGTTFTRLDEILRIDNLQSTVPGNTALDGALRSEIGEVSIAGDTGLSTVNKTVTFSAAFSNIYAIYITPATAGAVVGNDRCTWSTDSESTANFIAHVATTDGTNFGTTGAGTAYWIAIGN